MFITNTFYSVLSALQAIGVCHSYSEEQIILGHPHHYGGWP